MSARIDTHQHIVPPTSAAWLERRGITAGGLPIPPWSADRAVDLMAAVDMQAGNLSVSTPGVYLGDDAEARSVARDVSEFAADVVRQRPNRFGFFATLMLPDVYGARAGSTYAFDLLKADGMVRLTNSRGTYLSD